MPTTFQGSVNISYNERIENKKPSLPTYTTQSPTKYHLALSAIFLPTP